MANVLILLTLPEPLRSHYRDRLRRRFPATTIELVDHHSKTGPYIGSADALVTFGWAGIYVNADYSSVHCAKNSAIAPPYAIFAGHRINLRPIDPRGFCAAATSRMCDRIRGVFGARLCARLGDLVGALGRCLLGSFACQLSSL